MSQGPVCHVAIWHSLRPHLSPQSEHIHAGYGLRLVMTHLDDLQATGCEGGAEIVCQFLRTHILL